MGLYAVLAIIFLFLVGREIGHGPAGSNGSDAQHRASVAPT
jgi:hypothetical protein